MDDEPDSGHPTPRDEIPMSTPIRKSGTPRVQDHFRSKGQEGEAILQPQLEQHLEDSSFSSPRTHASRQKTDEGRIPHDTTPKIIPKEGIRNAITAERDRLDRNKLDRTREEEAHKTVQNLQFSLEGNRTELKHARDTIAQRDREIEEKATAIVAMREQQDQLEKKLRDLEGQLHAHEQKPCELCERLRMEKAGVIERLISTEADLQQSENSLSKCREQLLRFETEIATSRLQIATLTSEMAGKKRKAVDLETTNAQTRAEMAEKLEKAQEELAAKQREKKEAVDECISYKRKLDDAHKKAALTDKQLETVDFDMKMNEAALKEAHTTISAKDQEIVRQMIDITTLTEQNTRLEQKCQDLEKRIIAQEQKVCEACNKLNGENTALMEKLDHATHELRRTETQLSEQKAKILQQAKEAGLLQPKIDRLEADLAREKAKLKDMEDVSDNLAKKEVETSEKLAKAENQLASKHRECQQASDELATTKRSLEDVQTRIAAFQSSAEQTSTLEKRHDELQQINQQLAKEVDYLRSETKDRPTRSDYQQLQSQAESLHAKLEQEMNNVRSLKEQCGILKGSVDSSKELRQELDRKTEMIKDREVQIATLQSSSRTLQEDLGEKAETHSKMIKEYEQFRRMKEREVQDLVAHFEAATASYAALHAQYQEAQLKAAEGSTVWDNLPETLRNQLPIKVKEALMSLKIDRADVLSIADSQNSDTVDSCSKIADALEAFYRENLRPNDTSYNILQLTAKLLRASAVDNDPQISDFSSSVSQFIEKREQKLVARISELEQLKSEERQSKFDYHTKANSLEAELDDERRAHSSLQWSMTTLKADLQASRNLVTTRNDQLKLLREEVERLKKVEYDYKEMIRAVGEYQKELKDREDELDEQHNNELGLHKRIRAAQAEAEQLKREKEELKTNLHRVEVENSTIKGKLVEAEHKLASSSAESRKAVETAIVKKRYNQDTIRMCFENIDEYEKVVESLRRKNAEKRQVIDTIRQICITDPGGAVAATLKHLEKRCPKTHKADEEQEQSLHRIRTGHNQMIRERSTPELRAAFREARDNRRAEADKENRRN